MRLYAMSGNLITWLYYYNFFVFEKQALTSVWLEIAMV